MDINLFELLNKSDTLLLFTALAFGLLIGRIRFGSFEVGDTTGVLLVALFLGHFGFNFHVQTESLGFMLFIFCVGIEAGPNFFSTFLQDGVKYVAMAAVVCIAGIIVTVAFAKTFGFGPGLAAGMLAGALTSTPTLVGAQDSVLHRLTGLGEEEKTQLLSDISVGYAITYVVGLVGLLIFIRYVPALLRVDLAEEAKKVAKERGMGSDKKRVVRTPISRAYLVTEELVEKQIAGQTLRELGIYEKYGVYVEKLKRNGQLISPDSETVLKAGDKITIVGYPKGHSSLELNLIDEVFDPDLLDFSIESEEVVVKHSFAVGKRIEDLRLDKDYNCFPSALIRSQIEMPVDKSVVLNAGDVLTISGERQRLQKVTEKIGFANLMSNVSDLVAFSFFFIFGLMLGQFTVTIGEMTVGLGNAGGLLFAGILMGYFRANHPTFGHVPQGALNMLKDLGLNIFMVSIGLKAGSGIVEALMEYGIVVILCGLAIMIVPVLAGYFFGRWVMKMNPALLLGAVTGSMTSTPSLNVVNEVSKSNIPSLGYAGAYTFANVFLTLAGTIIVAL